MGTYVEFFEPTFIFLVFVVYGMCGLYLIFRNIYVLIENFTVTRLFFICLSMLCVLLLVLYEVAAGYFYDPMPGEEEVVLQHIIGGGFDFNLITVSIVFSCIPNLNFRK